MMDNRSRRATLAVGAAILVASAGCSDGGTHPENLRFGTIGEARLELVTPLVTLQGAGALAQILTWSSEGPWRLTERISYQGRDGDENIRSSTLNPEGLAGRYGTWITHLNSEAIKPFELSPVIGDGECPLQTRLTLTVTDEIRHETREWTRCVIGTLGTIDEGRAGPDPQAARVALAAKLLRDNALVEGLFQSSFDPSYPFATLARGEDTPISQHTPRAILSEEAWRHLWVQHTGSAAGLPAVDFKKDLVLIGLHPNGPRREAGDSIEIRKVLPVGEGTVVQMTLRRPGAFCSPAERIHVPYHFVVAPRVPLPITFQMPVAEEPVPCG